jgi:hypothetical protein
MISEILSDGHLAKTSGRSTEQQLEVVFSRSIGVVDGLLIERRRGSHLTSAVSVASTAVIEGTNDEYD